MSEEAPSQNNELEKPTNETKEQQEWESLDDEVPFVDQSESAPKSTESEKPNEAELRQKLVDEAKTTNEIKEEIKYHDGVARVNGQYCYEPELKKKLIGKNADPLKKLLGKRSVMSEIDKILKNDINGTIGPAIYITKSHSIGKFRNYSVSVEGETVFYASKKTRSFLSPYIVTTFTDGDWRKELHEATKIWGK